MWKEEDELAYQTFLKRIKEGISGNTNLKISEEERALLYKLLQEYIEAENVPGNEVKYYEKIICFYNIFMDDYLERYPDAFSDLTKLTDARKIDKIYPALKELESFIRLEYLKWENAGYEALNQFVAAPSSFSDDERRYLGMNTFRNHPYSHPKGDPQDLSNFSYKEMVARISKNYPDLKREREQAELIKNYYRKSHSWALLSLHNLYNNFSILDIQFIPHACYRDKFGDPILYTKSTIKDILPHSIFEKVIKMKFLKECRDKNNWKFCKLASQLLAKMIVKEKSKFQDFVVHHKHLGADPGFVLESPTTNLKFYGKYNQNIFAEYFCAKVMNELGIKMPESEILIDEFGNPFFLTMDASREYSKGKINKKKTFETIGNLLQKAPTVAFAFEPNKADLPLEEQNKIVQTFIEHSMNSKKSRISYAKIILSSLAFGLSDLGGHGYNIGLIATNRNGRNYNKFGIIDYNYKPVDITKEDLLKTLENIASTNIKPVFKMMYEQIKSYPEEILEAAIELANPKFRTHSKEGYYLTYSSSTRIESRVVIERVFKEYSEEMKRMLPEKAYKEMIEDVQKQKDLMIKNLEFVSKQLPLVLPVNKEKYRNNEKPDL